MDKPIKDFVNKNCTVAINNIDSLPFTYSCEGFSLEEIIEKKELETAERQHFNEKYIYLLYGKPLFSVSQEQVESRTDLLYCPCCLIFNNMNVNISRVYPFDPVEFIDGIYEDYFHPKMDREKFELENSLEGIKKFINVFFNDNNEYINGIANRINTTNAYVDSLINLFLAKGNFKVDEKSRTIEILTDKNISIKDELIGIVLPINLMRTGIIKEFIEENNIKYDTYFFRPLTRPIEYNQIVFEKVMRIIEVQK